VAGPLAFLATASVVAVGVVASSPEIRDDLVASSTTSLVDIANDRDDRQVVTRSQSRTEIVNVQERFEITEREATLRAVRRADTKLWATTDLNLWTAPDKQGENVGLLAEGKKVLVTGRKAAERIEVVVDGKARWVSAGYLTDDKPVEEEEETSEKTESDSAPAADVDATCSNGSAVSAGVSPNVVAVHEAVCANFPEITSYGTFRSDGEHSQGLAVDIMVSGERGWQVADFVRAHYSELGVSYIIYAQNIWSVERSGEGWRGMSDRGSSTANHYDHVHVTTY
jgi:uncharacterized protein YraI